MLLEFAGLLIRLLDTEPRLLGKSLNPIVSSQESTIYTRKQVRKPAKMLGETSVFPRHINS